MDHDKEMLGDLGEEMETVETKVATDTPSKPEVEAPENTDTETDTAEADTKSETVEEPEVSPDTELLKKFGIDGEFGSVDAALAAISHKNRQIEEQRRRESKFMDDLMADRERRLTPKKETPQLTPDEYQNRLLSDPEFLDQYMKSRGYVKREELNPLEGQVQRLATETVVERNERMVQSEMPELKDVAAVLAREDVPSPGQNKTFDLINAEFRRNHVVSGAVHSGRMTNMEAIRILYDVVKSRNGGAKAPAAIIPITPAEKAAAKTSGGGKRTEVRKTYDTMSADERSALSLKETERLLFEAGRLEREDLMEYRPPD